MREYCEECSELVDVDNDLFTMVDDNVVCRSCHAQERRFKELLESVDAHRTAEKLLVKETLFGWFPELIESLKAAKY